MTAGAAVLFWPAAPFFLLRKGKDVNINKGIVLEVFTDQDHIIRSAKADFPTLITPAVSTTPTLQLVSARSAAPAASSELAIVNITSDLPGAEVEINGTFVGSTPSTSKLMPGMHRITVKHGANVWSRDLNVQPGGNVNVNALLK